MKRTFVTAAVLAMFAVLPQKSYACFCVTDEVPQAYDQAKAVFIGEVTEIVKPRTDDPYALPAERLFVIKFKVEKSWKGAGFLDAILSEISVLSDQGRAGCFSWGPFLEGRKYLVYAMQMKEEDLAVLFSCNRTSSLENASDDLMELRRMQSPFFGFQRPPNLLERNFLNGAHNKPCS